MEKEYTNKQIKAWEEIYEKSLTEPDYEEISVNLNCFFSIIKRWNEDDKVRLTNNKEESSSNQKEI